MRTVAFGARARLLLASAACALLAWLAAPAQDRKAREEPLVRAADTVSPQARKYLESLPDPATLPAWPAPDDLDGWRRAQHAAEAESEPAVQAA